MSMIALTIALSLSIQLAASDAPPEQTLVVTTASWSATHGLAHIVRDGAITLGPVPIRVGRSGLGWGIGQHDAALDALPGEPTKREGDGRAPAGIFEATDIVKRPTADGLYCVDDAKAPAYNTLVRWHRPDSPPWSSAEDMTDYRVAVVVNHNAERVPGRGSCIFLHDGTHATAGCTAFARPLMDDLLTRLDGVRTRVVQLPIGAYHRLREPWGLPKLPQTNNEQR